MPTYKGNKGNLLQHWVLCELVSAAREHVSRLQFIDAHAMAPMAEKEEPECKDSVFESVRAHLPGQGSLYEKTWRSLEQGDATYPNSANFVKKLWSGRVVAMLLCEKDERTVEDLGRWARAIPDVEIARGDWRCRFVDGLSMSESLRDLTFVSFDPYLISRHCSVNNPCKGNMYPEDLYLVAKAMKKIQTPVMIQLSTYTANGNNSQPDVEQCIRDRLVDRDGGGIEQIATVTAGGDMMSVVLARRVEWAGELTSLNERFQRWRKNITRLRSTTSA